MVEIAAIISATAAAASAATGIASHRQQKKSLARQQQQQQQAQTRAINEQTRSLMQEKAIRQNEPDISSLLASNLDPKAGTLLSGPAGVDPKKLNLGTPKLLGE